MNLRRADTPAKPGIRRIATARGHRYTVDGYDTPGVTTLIGKGIPKPGLMYWSARTVAEYVADSPPGYLDMMRDSSGRDPMVNFLKKLPWDKRDAAAAKGTDVHTIAEKMIHGEAVDVPEHLTGYVASAVKFMDDWRVAPVVVEAVVASRQWRYCGTGDLIADLPDGRRALMDYKTGRTGIYPETALQLAAYRHAEAYLGTDGTELPVSELGIDCTYAVWIREDGYDVLPVDTGPETFQFFLHVAHVGRGFDQMNQWVGQPEEWRAAA